MGNKSDQERMNMLIQYDKTFRNYNELATGTDIHGNELTPEQLEKAERDYDANQYDLTATHFHVTEN